MCRLNHSHTVFTCLECWWEPKHLHQTETPLGSIEYASGFSASTRQGKEKRSFVIRRTKIVGLIRNVHSKYMVLCAVPLENTLAYCINNPSNAIMSKTLRLKSFFFSSCGVPGHWRTHKLCKGSLYFEPKSSHKSNKRNLKKFVSHKWLSCNHFGLHQRKSFASIYCNNPQLFTDDRQNTKKYSLSHFIPDRNRNRTEPYTIFFSYCSRIPWNGCCLENRHAYTRKKGRSFESESMAKNRLCAARTTVWNVCKTESNCWKCLVSISSNKVNGIFFCFSLSHRYPTTQKCCYRSRSLPRIEQTKEWVSRVRAATSKLLMKWITADALRCRTRMNK